MYGIMTICFLFLISGVFAAPPVTDFTPDTISGPAPLLVSFTDLSSNIPTGWSWFFGDETYVKPWTEMTASAGWSTRGLASCVVTPDSSVLLTGGGWEFSKIMNDVWVSKDNGATWIRAAEHAQWQARSHHTSVVMPDGSVILMGGRDNNRMFLNDVWRSTDDGSVWQLMAEHAGWSPRYGQTSVALSDGSIVLMGGTGASGSTNDTWRSTDSGASWTLMNASSGWSPRYVQGSVAMRDGRIILMGGDTASGMKNDVWKSVDQGQTWQLVTANARWSPRFSPGTVVMPDDSIVLTGGYDFTFKNDLWRSTDDGSTWTEISAANDWEGRYGHCSVVLPDSSIVLTGGVFADNPLSYKNDVWRFIPGGSSEQNPVHVYTEPGNYTVSLRARNVEGFSSKQKAGSVFVYPGPAENQSSGILVIKSVSPIFLKQDTNTRVIITVVNRGTEPVHDIEILDSTQPEFPIIEGVTQFTTGSIEPNGTRILSYTLRGIKSGSFRLNRTAVMYADNEGNYHVTYSDYVRVEVLPSLIPRPPQNWADVVIRDVFAWFNGLGKLQSKSEMTGSQGSS